MKVRYSHEAVGDLRRLRELIEVKNPRAAQKAAAAILKGIAQSKEFPLLGTKVERAPNPEVVRDLAIGNYPARYLVHETEVYVLRIWHHREDRFYKVFKAFVSLLLIRTRGLAADRLTGG